MRLRRHLIESDQLKHEGNFSFDTDQFKCFGWWLSFHAESISDDQGSASSCHLGFVRQRESEKALKPDAIIINQAG